LDVAVNHFRTARDRADSRDFRFDPAGIALPPEVDLTRYCGPVYEQGTIASCTAHAVSSAATWLENRAAAPVVLPSRLFIYYNARRFLDEQGTDAGATMRDAIKSIAKVGACVESEWPYDPAQVTVAPPQPCYEHATTRAVRYYRISRDVTHLKSCLAQGFPFIFAMLAYQQPFVAAASNGGQLPLPGANPGPSGGHAVMAVGYDAKTIKAMNSLGTTFGDNGFFYLPFAYFTQVDPELTYDFWTIRKIE
jgi:C1A family cysteine protease